MFEWSDLLFYLLYRHFGMENIKLKFLYVGYRASFPGVKRPVRGTNNPPNIVPTLNKQLTCTSTSSLVYHEIGEVYLYLYFYIWNSLTLNWRQSKVAAQARVQKQSCTAAELRHPTLISVVGFLELQEKKTYSHWCNMDELWIRNNAKGKKQNENKTEENMEKENVVHSSITIIFFLLLTATQLKKKYDPGLRKKRFPHCCCSEHGGVHMSKWRDVR